MVLAGDPSTHLPLDPAINLDVHLDNTGVLILEERESQVGGYRNVVAVQEGGPHGDVLVALVRGGYASCIRHLLVVVRRVHVEPLVVHPDPLVRVARGQGDLERHGQEARRGHVQGVHRRVLEDEVGLCRPED